MRANNVLKNAYMNEIAKAWGDDAKMMAYFEKKVSEVYELSGGKLFAFEKPKIKTRFCFGCGQNAYATGKEISDAEDEVTRAYNDANFFMNENLKEVDEIITIVKTGKPSDACEWKQYTQLMLRPESYTGSPLLNVWFPVVRPLYDFENEIRFEHEREINITCSDEDRALILSALENERNKLIKRLNSYLKRNGLKNVRAWSYIMD